MSDQLTIKDRTNMARVEGYVGATGIRIAVNPYIYGLLKSKCGESWTATYCQEDIGVTREEVAHA